MKKIILTIIIFLACSNLSAKSIKSLEKQLEDKGVIPIDRRLVSGGEESYKNALEAQYYYVLEQEKFIIHDINVARNSCKIMGFSDNFLQKKQFANCVLKVWETRLIGKKFLSMKEEYESQEVRFKQIPNNTNVISASLNDYKSKQIEVNEKSNFEYQKIKLKEKLANVDYGKIVKYALGIAVAYYAGKMIGEALQPDVPPPIQAPAKSTTKVCTGRGYGGWLTIICP